MSMFRKLSLASGLRAGTGPKDKHMQQGFQGKVVKYTPYAASRHYKEEDDDLDEVAVISSNPDNVTYGSNPMGASCSSTSANGPRVVPGIITSAGPEKSHILSAVTYGK